MTERVAGSATLNPEIRRLEECRARLEMAGELPDLGITEPLMESGNYKDRMIAEYWQLKIRYEKLKKFNNKIEAASMEKGLKGPEHTCPDYLLREQQRIMGEYLHVLEIRAEMVGIIL